MAFAIPLALAATLAGLFLLNPLDITGKIFVLESISFLWLLLYLFSRYKDRASHREALTQRGSQDIQEETLRLERDTARLREALSEEERRLTTFKNLSSSARALGRSLEASSIRKGLLEEARNLFPQGRPRLVTFLPHDELPPDTYDAYVFQKKTPLLITDSARDIRFDKAISGVGSLVASPLISQGKLVGILRVEAESAEAFQTEDMRTLAVLSQTASLAFENSALMAKVKELSVRDALTSLFTRAFFDERLEAEVLRAARWKHPLSLVLFDVDHFKKVNDTFGHPAGDEVLKRVAGSLKRGLREGDFAARYGGEEMALIFPETASAQAREMAEQIRMALSRDEFTFSGQRASVTASAGVSTFPEDGQSARALIRSCDERLYRAKAEGRNRVISG